MAILHGLPKEVGFCRRCVMSNQRPSTSIEFKKKTSEIETAGFQDGICDTCHSGTMFDLDYSWNGIGKRSPI